MAAVAQLNRYQNAEINRDIVIYIDTYYHVNGHYLFTDVKMCTRICG